mgnify:CR=1 FL=1
MGHISPLGLPSEQETGYLRLPTRGARGLGGPPLPSTDVLEDADDLHHIFYSSDASV